MTFIRFEHASLFPQEGCFYYIKLLPFSSNRFFSALIRAIRMNRMAPRPFNKTFTIFSASWRRIAMAGHKNIVTAPGWHGWLPRKEWYDYQSDLLTFFLE
jgi:hypothetical protein